MVVVRLKTACCFDGLGGKADDEQHERRRFAFYTGETDALRRFD